MKCPECKKKLSRLDTTCPACGHVLTEQDIKKVKVKRRLALWIPLGSFLLLFALLLLIIIIPAPELKEITVNNPNSEVEYLDSLDITICCTNNGSIDTNYEVPISIDGEVVKTVNFEIPGYEDLTKEISIERDALPEAGVYRLGVSDVESNITLLGPAELNIVFPSDDLALAVGEPYEVEFEVENTGPSEGNFEYTITFDGHDVETGEMMVAAKSVGRGVATISSDSAGSFDLGINDLTLTIPFYESKPYENGHHLMRNTIKGYSYIEITNNTGQDIVAYVTKADDPATAVIARYITDGDVHKVSSIIHGDYYLFIQTGELWLPDITRFGKNNKVYQTDQFSFDNSMYGGYGSYQYKLMTLVDCENSNFLYPAEACPSIPE